MKHKPSKSSAVTKVAAEAGSRLREIREGRGLSMRDVQTESRSLAQTYGRREFEMVPSRIHMLERGLSVPSLFRLYSLSAIYEISVRELFRLYGLNLSGAFATGKK